MMVSWAVLSALASPTGGERTRMIGRMSMWIIVAVVFAILGWLFIWLDRANW